MKIWLYYENLLFLVALETTFLFKPSFFLVTSSSLISISLWRTLISCSSLDLSLLCLKSCHYIQCIFLTTVLIIDESIVFQNCIDWQNPWLRYHSRRMYNSFCNIFDYANIFSTYLKIVTLGSVLEGHSHVR